MLQAQMVLPDGIFSDISRSGPVPLYFQISSRIEGAIHSGELPAGVRLENEVTIGKRLGLSRPTIRHAIQALVDKGLLVKNPGVGTQVVHGKITRNTALTSLFDDMQRQGKQPTSRVLTHQVVEAPQAVAEAFGIETGSTVFHLRRVRFADGVPFAILENHLPVAFADLAPEQFENDSLHRLMCLRGASMRVSKQTIGARTAGSDEVELLGLNPGAPVLAAHRTVYDNSGKAVDVGRHCYRPDLYSFDITLVDK